MERQIFLLRRLYNKFLSQRIKLHKKKNLTLRLFTVYKLLPLVQANKPEYKELLISVMRGELKKLDLAYQSFFRRVKKGERSGFPKYRGKDGVKSIKYPDGGFKLNGDRISLSRIGKVKFKKHRELAGKIKTCHINKTPTGKWYICFALECPVKKPLPKTGKGVGMDVGINTFAVLSDGTEITTVKHFAKLKKRLKKYQVRLARKKKGSQGRFKAKLRVAKVYEDITNSRTDFTHQKSIELIRKYDLIVHEKLKIKNMSSSAKGTKEEPGKNVRQKAGLNRSILDMGWGSFLEKLKYKAEDAGRQLIAVDPRYTSQICSGCGEIVKKGLNVRTHKCDCGLVLDRDLNASINIYHRSQEMRMKPVDASVLNKQTKLERHHVCRVKKTKDKVHV